MNDVPPKRVTLRQIASVCNLSVSTVSQILNDRDTYSTEKTRTFVKETAQKLGYHPNIGYKLMHGISTKTVAVVLGFPDMIGHEYIQKILLMLIDRLNEQGYFVYTVKMPPEWSKRGAALMKALERGMEHMICLGKPCEVEELEYIHKRVHTCVSMGTAADFISSVDIDVFYGVTKILEHFRDSGCRRIKAITSEEPVRLAALEKFFGCTSKELTPHLVRLSSTEVHLRNDRNYPELAMQYGYEKTRELLKRDPDTDAIFYVTDSYALGGIRYLHEIGRVIGRDVRVAGYNNSVPIRCSPFPVSSVGQNEEEIVSQLLELSREKTVKHIMLKPEVFIRN